MNKELIIYRLKFDAPLHISDCRADGRVSQTTIPSDTFYAALTACLIEMGDKIDEPGDLGFRISSLFLSFKIRTQITEILSISFLCHFKLSFRS